MRNSSGEVTRVKVLIDELRMQGEYMPGIKELIVIQHQEKITKDLPNFYSYNIDSQMASRKLQNASDFLFGNSDLNTSLLHHSLRYITPQVVSFNRYVHTVSNHFVFILFIFIFATQAMVQYR